METFHDVINRLGGPVKVAELTGWKVGTISAWGVRDSIPPKWWPKLVEIGRRRGVTTKRLWEIYLKQ